jgi:hypothetical protein
MASAPGVPATLGSPSRAASIRPRVGRVTLVVLAIGVLLTLALTWTAARAHADNESRLLEQQAEEATAVLQQAVPAITAKVQEAARIGALLQGDPAALERELARDVGEEGRFVAISVTRASGASPIAVVGEEPTLVGDALADAAAAVLEDPSQVHVTADLEGPDRRLVYSATAPGERGILAHAEQQLMPDPVNPERQGVAFESVHTALYLGDTEAPEALLTASTGDLPFAGRRTERSIPLGNQTMRFVVAPVDELGGGLLEVLPWLAAAAGLLSAGFGAVLVESLHRRRRDAEAFTTELHEMYRREHAIAHTLQHSLLPTHMDQLEGIEVAARYFPGAEGAEIGGDWYDVIKQGGDSFTVVVGDVVGRGVQAAAVMAAMRYGSHAVAGQVSEPHDILEAVNGLEHIRGDFVTMLCGSVDLTARTVRFASAGHPAPLLLTPEGAAFIDVDSGPPIGFLDGSTYRSSTVAVPAGSIVVLFTDGLYERRGEDIDVGLERLRAAASGVGGSVEQVLDALAAKMLGDGVRDDTAMLALRMA